MDSPDEVEVIWENRMLHSDHPKALRWVQGYIRREMQEEVPIYDTSWMKEFVDLDALSRKQCSDLWDAIEAHPTYIQGEA